MRTLTLLIGWAPILIHCREGERFPTVFSPIQRTELPPPSIKLARHATGVIGIKGGAIGAGCARRREISQRRNTLGPVAAACPPKVGADKRLGAMLERLSDRNQDHRRRLLAVDSKTPLQDRIDTDPGPTVDPICLVRPGDQEDQGDARVLDHVLDAVDPIVAAPVGDQQCAAVVLNLDEARLVALGRAVEPVAAPCRQDEKWRGGDEARPTASTWSISFLRTRSDGGA